MGISSAGIFHGPAAKSACVVILCGLLHVLVFTSDSQPLGSAVKAERTVTARLPETLIRLRADQAVLKPVDGYENSISCKKNVLLFKYLFSLCLSLGVNI